MSPAHRFTLSDNTSMTPDADAAVSVALARQLHEIAAFCLARLLQVSLSRLHPLLAHRHSFLASFKMPCANARYIRPRPAFSFAALIAISFPNFPHNNFFVLRMGHHRFFCSSSFVQPSSQRLFCPTCIIPSCISFFLESYFLLSVVFCCCVFSKSSRV